MASDNETVKDIVKRVRRACNYYPLPTASAEMLKLVREIKEAHKREVEELRECLKEAVEWSCGNPDEACEDCVAHGGDTPCKCEKWRKALDGEKSE